MFDSKTDETKLVPIKVVAQRSGFYTPETESWLAQTIESPANLVMEKLIAEQSVTDAERQDFAQYVACMFMRVPDKRERMAEAMPDAMDKTRAELPGHLRKLGQEQGQSEEEIAEMLAQIGPATDGLLATPPKELTDFINDPSPAPESIDAIFKMNWMMVKSPPSMFFITNDNPVFFYPDARLKDAESEVFLPLSPRYAFHACYERRPGALGVVVNMPRAAVIEFNRRMARQATRYCFSDRRADWTLRLMKKPHLIRPIRFPGTDSPKSRIFRER